MWGSLLNDELAQTGSQCWIRSWDWSDVFRVGIGSDPQQPTQSMSIGSDDSVSSDLLNQLLLSKQNLMFLQFCWEAAQYVEN